MPALLTIKEAAAQLRVSASLLYGLAQTGRIEHFRLNRRILFTQAQIESFLEAARHPVSTPGAAP